MPSILEFANSKARELKGLNDVDAVAYLQRNYLRDIPVEQIAAQLGVTLPPAPAAPQEGAGILRTAGDIGIKAAQGVVDLGASVVGLGSLATGGLVGKGMEAIGYDPKQTNEFLGQYLSDSQKASDKAVSSADGFVDTVGAAMANPRSIAGAVAQSLPGMLAGGGIQAAIAKRIAGKAALATTEGAAAAAGKTGAAARDAALATAAGRQAAEEAVQKSVGGLVTLGAGIEGAQTAGNVAQQAQAEGREFTDYAPGAIAAGLGTAVIGKAAGKLVGDAATDVFTGTKSLGGKIAGSLPGRMAKAGFSEGFLEEMPQSAQEQFFTNVALGKDDPTEGVGNAAGMGLVTGAAMGIGLGGFTGQPKTPKEKADEIRRDEKLPEVGPLTTLANQQTELKAQSVENVADALKAAPSVDVGGSVGDGMGGANTDAALANMEKQAQRDLKDQKDFTPPPKPPEPPKFEADPGELYPVEEGDIKTKAGYPFKNKLAATNAQKQYPGSTVVQVMEGWVVRPAKDANVSTDGSTQPVPTTSTGSPGADTTAGVGTGSVVPPGQGAKSGPVGADTAGQSVQPTGGVDAGAVGEKPKLNAFGLPLGVKFAPKPESVTASDLKKGDWIISDGKPMQVFDTKTNADGTLKVVLDHLLGRTDVDVKPTAKVQRKVIESTPKTLPEAIEPDKSRTNTGEKPDIAGSVGTTFNQPPEKTDGTQAQETKPPEQGQKTVSDEVKTPEEDSDARWNRVKAKKAASIKSMSLGQLEQDRDRLTSERETLRRAGSKILTTQLLPENKNRQAEIEAEYQKSQEPGADIYAQLEAVEERIQEFKDLDENQYGTVDNPLKFISGMSAPNDFLAVLNAGRDVGISINELSGPSISKIAKALVESDGSHLFIDTGAFSIFMANLKAAKRNKELEEIGPLFAEAQEPMKGMDFEKIFNRTDTLLRTINQADGGGDSVADRVFLVMPDIVGDQTGSLELVKRYAEDINAWGKSIVPLQGGELTLKQAYEKMMENLGRDGISPIIGIPSKAAAVSNKEFRELLDAYGDNIGGIHILGAFAEKTLEPRLKEMREAGYDGPVSADANRLRSLMWGETTRAEALRKLLGGEMDEQANSAPASQDLIDRAAKVFKDHLDAMSEGDQNKNRRIELTEQAGNPGRYHPVSEIENANGFKIGDRVHVKTIMGEYYGTVVTVTKPLKDDKGDARVRVVGDGKSGGFTDSALVFKTSVPLTKQVPDHYIRNDNGEWTDPIAFYTELIKKGYVPAPPEKGGLHARELQKQGKPAELIRTDGMAKKVDELYKQHKAEVRESEAATFTNLSTSVDLAGKSLEDIKAMLKEALPYSKSEVIDKMATNLQKAALKNAAEIEKNKHRDPEVLQKVMAEMLPSETDVALAPAFNQGFAHALAGKTKSTLAGENLATMQLGYEAARKWIKTEIGRAFYEGKPVAKLENTGVDLRRHWELMQQQMKENQSDIVKVWKAIEKATNRANLFAPLMPDGVKPGFKLYVTELRDAVPTFKDWMEKSTRFLGQYSWRGDEKSDLDYMLEGRRYPSELDEEAKQKFKTDETYRIEYLRSLADKYLSEVKKHLSFMSGITSVKDAAEKFEESYIKEIIKREDGAIRSFELTEAGDAFLRFSKLDSKREFARFRAGSDWAQALIEKEDTIALPNRSKPLVQPALDRVTREGLPVVRDGRNVDPQEFKKVFGFADIGFGSYVAAKQDQDHLNYAYDSFMDLARHFGAPTNNVGLGIHFTIGALGSGRKAAAHFQPRHPGPDGAVQVINLTNTKGDGTVYHEWVHALDHNLGGEWKSNVRTSLLRELKVAPLTVAAVEKRAKDFLIGSWYFRGDKKLPNVEAAIRGINHIQRSPTAYKTNADAMDPKYWGNDFELIARAGESWATDTLGGVNNYLVNPEWSGDGAVTPAKGYRGTPYPTGDERKRINLVMGAFAKAVKWESGKPTIKAADFEAELNNVRTQDEKDAIVRLAQLKKPEEMQKFYDELTVIEDEKNRARAEQVEAQIQADAEAKAQKEREEKEAMDAAAAAKLKELEALDPPKPNTVQGPLTEDDLEALFDQAAAELREVAANEPDTPPPGEAMDNEPAEPKPEKAPALKARDEKIAAKNQTAEPQASKLIAEAAKQGVKGIDEALTGLTKLFGGGSGRLNSFPAGFDEETYKKAKPHFKAALEAFQAAGKSLKDLFQLLIQQFGDGVKMYAIQFAKDEALTNNLGQQDAAPASPSSKVAAWVQDKLTNNTEFSGQELFDFADTAFEGTQSEGKYTPKDAYDAMEMGMNRYILANPEAFTPNTDFMSAVSTVARLEQLTKLLATQTKRTAEQDEFQQYSTVPAFAFVANWVAGVRATDLMMEPSAGIGGIATFARNAGAKLVLNELSSRRADVLQEVFPTAQVFRENAEQINNILPADIKPTVVVMNPPFSATAGRLEKNNTKVGAQHVEQALKRLDDGGRLVAIVGEGMAMDRPAFKSWWAEISAKYAVRAVIPVDGKGYAKYGTTFSNALLVIDKVKPDGKAIVTKPAETYEQLVKSLLGVKNARPETVGVQNDSSVERDSAESERDAAIPQGEGVPGMGVTAGGGGGVGAIEPTTGGSGVGGSGGGRTGGRTTGKPAGTVRQPDTGGAGGSDKSGGSGDGATDLFGRPDNAESKPNVEVSGKLEAAGELTNSVFENYQPQRLQIAGAKPHPGLLVQSAAMASVLPPEAKYTPDLPKETITEGKLSIAQLEAVVYAGQAHQETLSETVNPNLAAKHGLSTDTKYRKGFFIGDGTGVGKGREIGGIILDNLRQGRKKAIWISEKQGLMNDAKRDFRGVGGSEDLVFNLSDAKDGETREGVMFTTYSTLKMGQDKAATGKPATKGQLEKVVSLGSKVTLGQRYEGKIGTVSEIDFKYSRIAVYTEDGRRGFVRFTEIDKVDGRDIDLTDGDAIRTLIDEMAGKKKKSQDEISRVEQIVRWVGKDFDGVIAFDEAHNAGNAVAIKGDRGTSEPSKSALAMVDLQARLPNARVIYVSATGATTVSNLAYASRLGLWGAGTPFPSVSNFVDEMTAGGLATMELVARDMKQMGVYLARSLSYDGVSYGRIEHELTETQDAIYNRLCDAWQVTIQNFEKALEATGATEKVNGKSVTRNSAAKSAARSAYWGAQQRFFNQIITSMQMPSVIDQIERDIAAGKAVVLQLVNTNEAQQERALSAKKEEGESVDLEDLDLTPRDQLMQMIQKSFPVVQMQEVIDENGNKRSEPVRKADGTPVENAEAVAMREQLLQDLKDIRVPDGPLELVMNHFGPEVVAEITGRKQRVVRKADKDGVIKAQLETRGSSSARADADSFMADKKRVLIFSDAGGTGYSFHADLTKTNQRPRAHYLIQPGWRADKAVQGFGRTHRTNQKSAPHYWLASTNIPAQKRFLSSIARRLDMLGAMTKGQRDTANQGLFSEKDNLESKYATQAVRQLLMDAKVGQLENITFDQLTDQLGFDNLIDPNTGQIAVGNIPSVGKFLNRMLSMKTNYQEMVFNSFISRMEEKIEVAAARGELDAGLETIKALSVSITSDEVGYTDPKSGAETRLVDLELTLPTTMYPFPNEKTQGAKIEWLTNAKSGRVWGKVLSGTSTLKSGAVVDRFRMLGTGGTQIQTADKITDEGYTKITAEQARELWDKETAERPPTYTQKTTMIVGALLPIWDRLKTDGEVMRVMRTQTQDGQRLLGRVVPQKDVAEIRKRLNVSSPESKLAPADVMRRILKGEVGELSNGWTLSRVKVAQDLRIEIKNRSYWSKDAMRELTGYGVIHERISFNDRLFVPTGAAGIPVLQTIFESKPLVSLVDPNEKAAFSRANFYYSALSKGIEGISAKAQGGPAWIMNITGLINKGAVKADEVEWSGIRDWLQMQTGKVTKEQVMEYLDANGVQVEEVNFGAAKDKGEALAKALEGTGYKAEYDPYGEEVMFTGPEGEELDYVDLPQEILSIVQKVDDEQGADGETKYENYQLPGGENYREVLLTLPEKKPEAKRYSYAEAQDQITNFQNPIEVRDQAGKFVKNITSEFGLNDNKAKIESGEYKLYQYVYPDEKSGYKSSHWDQRNVLAHIRLNDRTDADGNKVLFVEEVQSDWGQKGKKDGFSVNATELPDGYQVVKDGASYEVHAPDGKKYGVGAVNKEQAIRNTLSKLNSGVPRAPFVTNTDKWLNLALKRIVKMAVDEGYDKVAFVNGEQSAERYDLSKQISMASAIANGDGTYNLVVEDKSGNEVGDMARSGKKMTPQELEDTIGKDLAKKLIDGAEAAKDKPWPKNSKVNPAFFTLRGLDLKVGGEGMKAFYDQIVPTATKALLKKVGGGNVEVIASESIGTDKDKDGKRFDNQEQSVFTITPAMREKASGGLPLFAKGSSKKAMPLSDVKTIASTIADKWANAPEIVVAANIDDPAIPQAVRDNDQEQRSLGAKGNPEGFFYGGKVYLIADQLASVDDVARVLFHETLGHAGLRGAFGNSLNDILSQIIAMRRSEVAAKAKQYGLDMNKRNEAMQAAEEVLAVMAQTKPEMGYVKRAIAAIRNFLRGLGLNLKLTDNDIIANYILPARAFVERGQGVAGGGMAFSIRSTGKDEPATIRKIGDKFAVVTKSTNGEESYEYYPSEKSAREAIAKQRLDADTRAGKFAYWWVLGDSAESFQSAGVGRNNAVDRGLAIRQTLDARVRAITSAVIGRNLKQIPSRKGFCFKCSNDAAAQGIGDLVIGISTNRSTGERIWHAVVMRDGMVYDPTYGKWFAPGVYEEIGFKESLRLTPSEVRDFAEKSGGVAADAQNQGLGEDPPMFSRATEPDNLTDTAKSQDFQKKVRDYIADLSQTSKKVSWWERTIGTQYHKAEKNADFKVVFDAAQDYISSTSAFANNAADLAKGILPQLESIADLKKKWLSDADRKAIAKPIFEGTLTWTRDDRGELVEAGDVATAGVVFTDDELKDKFKLDDKQIDLYRQFRASVDKSLGDMGVTDALRYLGKVIPKSLKRLAVDDPDLVRRAIVKLVADKADEAGAAWMQAQKTMREELKKYDKGRAKADAITRPMERAAALQKFDIGREELEGRLQRELDRAEAANEQAKRDQLVIDRKFERIDDLKARGYSPLTRYGRFHVTVKDPDTKDVIFFGLFETEREANKAARDLSEEGEVSQGLLSEQSYKLFSGVSPETLEIMGEAAGVEDKAMFEAYIKMTKSQRSTMKRLLKRKGVPGFSEDVTRVLASFVTSNARAGSANLHLGDATRAASEIREGDVKDEAVKLVEYIKNPQEEAQAVRGLLFAQFLGGSVASALVNLTQPFTMTLPYLSQFGNPATAAARLTNAMRQAVTGVDKNSELGKAMHRAEQDGIVSPQEIHQLQAEVTKSSNYHRVLRKAGFVWGSMFSLAEQFNRRTTFIAAYNQALADKIRNPYEFATKAVEETQGIYCVDDQTECLTASGWKTHSQMQPGEMVYAVNEDGALVESALLNVHRFTGNIDATEFKNANGMSMILTDDHTCLVQNYNSRDKKYQRVKRVKAKDVKIGHHFLRVPLSDATGRKAVYTNDEVTLFAWVAAEGHLFAHRGVKEKRGVGFVQSQTHNPQYVAEIDALLARLGGHFNRKTSSPTNRKDTMVCWQLRKPLWSKIHEALPGKLITFDFVNKLTIPQMRIFLDTFIKGDGSRQQFGGPTISQKDIGNLDAMQAMAVLTGQTSTVYHRLGDYDVGALYIAKNSIRAYRKEMTVERVKLDMAWCPETEHGTWIARRNGRTFVTGNSKSNKPNWARGAIGGTVFTFKQFSISYLEFLTRLPKREQLFALAILMLAAGAEGLPFGDDLDDLIDTIGQKLGYNWNTKREKRQFLTEQLGMSKDFAEFLLKGVSTVAPLDVSGRMGMANLIPGTGLLLENKLDKSKDVTEFLGPIGSLGQQAVAGAGKLLAGDIGGAGKEVAPVAVQNALKAVDMMQTGMYRDKGGRKVVDTDATDAFFKGLGFQPRSVADIQLRTRIVSQDNELAKAKEKSMAERWAEARFEGDQKAEDKIREELRLWNSRNPEAIIKINMADIVKRVRNMKRDKAERTIKQATPEMRGYAREELQ